MYQSQQISSFSPVLTLQQTPDHLESKHSELRLLLEKVSVFPSTDWTEKAAECGQTVGLSSSTPQGPWLSRPLTSGVYTGYRVE